MIHGYRLGQLFGIQICVDSSLLVIFGLIMLTLAIGTFPSWHPDWSTWLSLAVAFIAATTFFLSVLAHELAHAIVGRRLGVPIRSITLYLFGGIAATDRDAPNPRAEFLMTIVGPLTSLLIGALAIFVASLLAPSIELTATSTEAFLQGLGPTASVLMWIGPINVLLAVFNLIPGFPLDGGRVLRSLLWWGTGDRLRATRWASRVGQFIGLLIMATGIFMILGGTVPVFGRGFLGGLWLTLIGWFLMGAAQRSYEQIVTTGLLQGLPVRRIVTRSVESVPSSMSLCDLVDGPAIWADQDSFPVDRDGRLIGFIHLARLREASRDEWSSRTVADLTVTLPDSARLDVEDDASTAIRMMTQHDVDQLPVTDGERLLGFVRQRDILRWLYLQDETPVPV